MKYKVGDNVRVRKDLEVNKSYGDDAFVPQMQKYSGKSMTITCIKTINPIHLKKTQMSGIGLMKCLRR